MLSLRKLPSDNAAGCQVQAGQLCGAVAVLELDVGAEALDCIVRYFYSGIVVVPLDFDDQCAACVCANEMGMDALCRHLVESIALNLNTKRAAAVLEVALSKNVRHLEVAARKCLAGVLPTAAQFSSGDMADRPPDEPVSTAMRALEKVYSPAKSTVRQGKKQRAFVA